MPSGIINEANGKYNKIHEAKKACVVIHETECAMFKNEKLTTISLQDSN